MFATPNSTAAQRVFGILKTLSGPLCLAVWLAAGLSVPGADSGPAQVLADAAARAKNTYTEARARFQSNTNDFEAAWHFARACFDLAEFAAKNSERAKLADEGIAVSRQLVAQKPDAVQSHFYLGMNLGQLARTKLFGALKLVGQMETEFTTARRLDEHFEFAGPDRNLGLLYFETPSWSIGDSDKARQHLRKAAELAPAFPENRLNLLEAYLKWGERADATNELKALEELLPEARKQLTGGEWAASWVDWDKRLEEARRKLAVKRRH